MLARGRRPNTLHKRFNVHGKSNISMVENLKHMRAGYAQVLNRRVSPSPPVPSQSFLDVGCIAPFHI